MQEVSVSRDVAADPESIRAGFDDLSVDGDRVTVGRNIGLAELELTLELVESDAALAYEQVAGMFETMTTTYHVEANGDGATITARTAFELGGMIGSALDATLIKRQRTNELEDQLAYLEGVARGE